MYESILTERRQTLIGVMAVPYNAVTKFDDGNASVYIASDKKLNVTMSYHVMMYLGNQ